MPPSTSHTRGGSLPSRASGVTVLVTTSASSRSIASPAARAASGSSVPDAFITGCSSSSAPTRVVRSALTPPRRVRRTRPGPRRRAARARRRDAPRSRSRRRSRTPWAPRARPGTTPPPPRRRRRRRARGHRARRRTRSSCPPASLPADRARWRAEATISRSAARHELGGPRGLRVAEGREQPSLGQRRSERREQRGAESAADEQRARARRLRASKPRPNGPSTSTSAPTWASAASAGPRGWQRNVTPASSEATAESGRARKRIVRERAQHVELPGLARQRTCAPAGPGRTARAARRPPRASASSVQLLQALGLDLPGARDRLHGGAGAGQRRDARHLAPRSRPAGSGSRRRARRGRRAC